MIRTGCEWLVGGRRTMHRQDSWQRPLEGAQQEAGKVVRLMPTLHTPLFCIFFTPAPRGSSCLSRNKDHHCTCLSH